MVVGRVIGWLFLAAAITTLGWDIADAFGEGWDSTALGLNPWNWANHVLFGEGWDSTALGLLWFQNHSESLGLAQVIFQRFIPVIGPWLWDPVIQTILVWPAWAVFGVTGLFLRVVFRRRRRTRRSFDR